METIKNLASMTEFEGVDRRTFEKGFIEGGKTVLQVLFEAAHKEDWVLDPKNGVRRFFEIYNELRKPLLAHS